MSLLKTRYALSLIALFGALLANSLAAHAAQYTVTDLGTLGGTTSAAFGINASGQVTGNSRITGNSASHAFLYSGGVMTDLGSLGGNSTGRAINNSGVVTGSSVVSTNVTHAFRYNGSMNDLGVLSGGNFSIGRAINSAGAIVGGANQAGGSPNLAQFGVLDNGGGLSSLSPPLNNGSSEAFGINDSGAIVGVNVFGATPTAFLYSGGILTDLGVANGADISEAAAINSSGVIAAILVFLQPLGPPIEHAAMYNGAMVDLGTLGGTTSDSFALNNTGTIVGNSDITGDSAKHAFIYSGGVMTDLNTLISPLSGWTLTSATGINDSGLITGTGLIGGVQHAFILTPVPEPSTLMLAGTGAIGLFVVNRRRKSVRKIQSLP